MPCAIFRCRDIAAGFDRRLPYGFTAAELKQRMNLLARCVHTSEEAKVTSENLAWLRQVCVVARRPVLLLGCVGESVLCHAAHCMLTTRGALILRFGLASKVQHMASADTFHTAPACCALHCCTLWSPALHFCGTEGGLCSCLLQLPASCSRVRLVPWRRQMEAESVAAEAHRQAQLHPAEKLVCLPRWPLVRHLMTRCKSSRWALLSRLPSPWPSC